MRLDIKLVNSFKIILLRRVKMAGPSFSFKSSMSTGKKVEDDGKDHTKPGVNIFYMNYIIPGSEEQELIYP